MVLIDIIGVFNPKETEYSFFTSSHGMFSRIYHMIGHKTNLNKFQKTKNISSNFSNYNGMKLEINPKKKNPEKTQRHGG